MIGIQKNNWAKDKIFFLFIIPLFLYISLLPVMPLMEPDEARYSDIPSLMNRTGNYITPHLNHVLYPEKPPLAAEKHFLLIWIFFIFIFFSFSSSKLIPYIAPIFIPIAILFGHLFRLFEDRDIPLDRKSGKSFLYDLPIILMSLLFIGLILACLIRNLSLGAYQINHPFENGWGLILLPILFLVMMVFLPLLVERKWRKGWFFTVTILSTLFLVSIHFPISHYLTPYKSAYPVSKATRALLPPNQEVYQFRTSLYGIDFYNKIWTSLVGRYGGGELDFGIHQLPPEERSHYYLLIEEFYHRCKGKGELYCVKKGKENVEALKKRVSTLEVLWENGVYYFLRLRG